MDNKILNNRELAQIKRIAQNVDADYQKVCKLEAKQKELQVEINALQAGIDEMEAPVVRKTGGYRSTDIYKKVIIPQFNEDGTPKTDKDGRQLKVTKYVLRYGENILPPADEGAIVPPTTEEGLGSDFDIDKENVVNTVND